MSWLRSTPVPLSVVSKNNAQLNKKKTERERERERERDNKYQVPRPWSCFRLKSKFVQWLKNTIFLEIWTQMDTVPITNLLFVFQASPQCDSNSCDPGSKCVRTTTDKSACIPSGNQSTEVLRAGLYWLIDWLILLLLFFPVHHYFTHIGSHHSRWRVSLKSISMLSFTLYGHTQFQALKLSSQRNLKMLCICHTQAGRLLLHDRFFSKSFLNEPITVV